MIKRPPIPPPASMVFGASIAHPELWLWDSWTATCENITDLYCLALARTDLDGAAIVPARRNEFAFHVRRFRSVDGGLHWKDEGCVFAPSPARDGSFARNVWSGSVLDLPDGRRLHALTGIREQSSGRNFLQSIFIASAPSATAPPAPQDALLCPLRDYRAIRAAGYYLAEPGALGADAGEEGGPILAWRDPFLMQTPDGAIEIVWSAKTAPKTPALGRARIAERDGEWRVSELLPPISLPDDGCMTQAEVPKIYRDSGQEGFYLMVSACDRVSEAQPDHEVSKELRLFRSSSVSGPWRPWRQEGSTLPDMDHVFGASVFGGEFDLDRLNVVGPITEHADPSLQLTMRVLLAQRVRREAERLADL